jgi:seryl-tRNA synthetase
MVHILAEIIESEPQVIGFLSEFLNSTFAQISAIGVSGLASISLLLSKILPSRNFSQTLTDRYHELKDQLLKETTKLEELTVAQNEYQQATDDLIMEIAKHSPNKKIKELGEQLSEKKKQLTLQETIQAKVDKQVAKTIKVLKEKTE